MQKKTLRLLDETLGCAVQRRERMRASDKLKSIAIRVLQFHFRRVVYTCAYGRAVKDEQAQCRSAHRFQSRWRWVYECGKRGVSLLMKRVGVIVVGIMLS